MDIVTPLWTHSDIWMGSFNCAEFRPWHPTCSFTELQTTGVEKNLGMSEFFYPLYLSGPKYYQLIQNLPKSYQSELFWSFLYGQFHISIDKAHVYSLLSLFIPQYPSLQWKSIFSPLLLFLLKFKSTMFYQLHCEHEEHFIPFHSVFDSWYFRMCLLQFFTPHIWHETSHVF